MPAPKNNKHAVKPDDQKISGVGRLVIDLGPLKAEVVKRASARGQSLKAWIVDAIERKLGSG